MFYKMRNTYVLIVLWIMFSIFALLFSLHHVCVGHTYIFMLLYFIDCIFGWSFALLCDHCSHFYMTVLVYDQVDHMFTSCLLDRNLLVTLYFSFYYLLYLEGLICFMQVFQVTGIYVPSASHHSLCIYQGGEDSKLIRKLCLFVISIWLFWCLIKFLICSTSCLLDRNLLVSLYLSFYYLFYLEVLICFVQVFQVTGIYVPSSSQLLWFMIGGVIW